MDLYLEPKPGIPPTPAHLAEVIGKMKADGDKIIVLQPYQNRKTADTIANHTGRRSWIFRPSREVRRKPKPTPIGLIIWSKSVVKGFEAKK